jgi:hypothetical protein
MCALLGTFASMPEHDRRSCSAVRMAFWDYKNNTALTQPCDSDVESTCDAGRAKRSVYTIGVVGRCLTKQLAQGRPLTPPCRKLVSVAAPKDIRLFIQARPRATLLQVLPFLSTLWLTLSWCRWPHGQGVLHWPSRPCT